MWKTRSVLTLLSSAVATMALAQGAQPTTEPQGLSPASSAQSVLALDASNRVVALGESQTAAMDDEAGKTGDEPKTGEEPKTGNEPKSANPAPKPDEDNVKLEFGATIVADFYYNSARPAGPGVPFYLTPAPLPGHSQNTYDANARATMLSARLYGPKVGHFDLTAKVQTFLFDPAVFNDKYGILPFTAVIQLKDDKWLYSGGLQLQIFNPMFPNMLTWSRFGGSGNAGAGVVGQARVERYLHPSDTSQVTLTGGISEPIATTFSDVAGSEDNGWPNVEGRVALSLGAPKGEGAAAKQPFELAVSGVVGQIRTTPPDGDRVIADVWGVGTELRWAVTPRVGFLGEAYIGRTLGIWTGCLLQSKHPTTFEGIHCTGGWLEGYYYLHPETLHVHVGVGIDDPRDSDTGGGQKTFNETIFGNLVWNATKRFELGGELTYRKTKFNTGQGLADNSLDNDGFGFQTHMAFKF